MSGSAEPGRADHDLEALADLAETIARDAGTILLDGVDRPRTDIDVKSTGTDMVTEMDRASERLIVDALLAARPADGVLGEEGSDRPGTSGVRWVIDPLDGTTNYLYRHPGYNVSIAAEVEGRSVVGVVFDLAHQRLYRSMLGGGSTCNGEPISIGSETRLAHSLVGTGFGYSPERRTHQAEALAKVIGSIRDIRRMGAAAADLCSVADGRLDAYYEIGLGPWDWAAGSLVAAEAGARTGRFGGPAADPETECVVAAHPDVFETLVDLLASSGALQTR